MNRLFVTVLAVSWLASASAEPSFQGLGGFPGVSVATKAFSVSANGSVVVGNGTSMTATDEAFRWTPADGLVPLVDLPMGPSQATVGAVSGDGMTIVGNAPSTSGAFRWAEGSTAQALGLLPGGTFTGANATNQDGSVVVGYGNSSSSNGEAYRWTQSTGIMSLGDLPGGLFSSNAFDVSADGAIVVGAGISSSGTEAFRWTEVEGIVGLGALPGGAFFFSSANGVSADGSTIVGGSTVGGGTEAFRWTEAEGMVGLGWIPGLAQSSGALAASGDGSRIVGANTIDLDFGNEAAIWDAQHGMRSLKQVLLSLGVDEVADWSLQSAEDISVDGRTIVGWGFNPSGYREAWIATVPEPGSLVLAAVAAIGLSVFVWRP